MSAYDGVEICLDHERSDGKMYTLILKDEAPPPQRPDGRQSSTLSWEYDFCIDAVGEDVLRGGRTSGPRIAESRWMMRGR